MQVYQDPLDGDRVILNVARSPAMLRVLQNSEFGTEMEYDVDNGWVKMSIATWRALRHDLPEHLDIDHGVSRRAIRRRFPAPYIPPETARKRMVRSLTTQTDHRGTTMNIVAHRHRYATTDQRDRRHMSNRRVPSGGLHPQCPVRIESLESDLMAL